MDAVAIFGNRSGFNIRIFAMTGGGFYAVLYDVNTPVFQRRNNPTGTDITLGGSANVLDRFTAYYFDEATNTLTLVGAVDSQGGVQYTRQETYRFVGAYVIENTYRISTNGSGTIGMTNWNFYKRGIYACWDVDNANFGTNGGSTKSLGMGVQFDKGGSVYGSVADNKFNTRGNIEKRSLASQNGVAVIRCAPGGATNVAVGVSTPLSLTQWFFKSEPTLYDFALQAQLAIADAKGYTGNKWSKIQQVTGYLNKNIFDDKVRLQQTPSFYYGSSMYARDALWHSFEMSDAEEIALMNTWDSFQQPDGRIPTYVNTDNAVSVNHDESSMLHVIRQCYDKFARGMTVNLTVAQNVLDYMRTQITAGQFRNASGIVQHWIDIYFFPVNSVSSYNQGIYACFLKACRKLGLSVTDNEIALAQAEYRALYSTANKAFKWVSDQNYIGPDSIVGEALALFVLGESLLTDEMVINHLETELKFGNTPYGIKCLCNLNGTSFVVGGIPVGDYQSGGAWMLYEYLLYYVAAHHGYSVSRLEQLIEARVNAELAVEPVSHEFLQTDATNPVTNPLPGSCPSTRWVFAWNIAMDTIFYSLPTSKRPFASKKMEVF